MGKRGKGRMNRIFKLVFSMSLSGSMLILTLFILRPLYKNRTGRRWQYYIWLVVIGRLLLPFSPKESLSGTLADRLWQSVSQESSRLDADFDSGEDFVDDSGNDSENDFENDSGGDSPQAPDKENATADFSGSIKAFVQNKDGSSMGEKAAKEAELEKAEDLFSHLWMVWIGVAALLLMRKATIYQSYVKYIKAGRKEVSNVRLLDTLSQVGERVGVKRPVELYVNEMAPSAMLLGFFRPCIVLPCADLREEHFLYTVWHELSHYKRLDLIYKWLVQLTICVHWFNPFVWMMGRELGRACELACDEAVICRLDGDGRIAYGDTLLEALKAGVSCKNPGSAVMLSKDAKQLKERLWTIMNFKKRSKLTVFLSGALTAALLVGATTAGAAVSDEAGGEKVTAPISLKNVKDGDYAWIGTYDLSENDKVYYKVSAKGGKQLSVGFAKPGDDHPDTTYVTVCNERQDGNLEAVCGPYIWKSPLKPGKYRLFVHAKGADLKNVEGAAVIVKKESAQLDTRIQTLAAKNVDRSAEYASFGITANGKAHYYKDSRIRIFQDMKADRSFEYSFIDRKGTVDIRLLRGKSGAVNALELIPKAQANEILKDLFGNVPSNQKTGKEKAAGKAKKTVTKAKKPLEYTDVLRCDRENLPSGLQGILENKCKDRRWYVIRTADRQYVYFNNLPRDYAFHISGKKLYVRDMGRHTGVCVLLSLGKDVDFSLYYNDRKVRFTSIDV